MMPGWRRIFLLGLAAVAGLLGLVANLALLLLLLLLLLPCPFAQEVKVFLRRLVTGQVQLGRRDTLGRALTQPVLGHVVHAGFIKTLHAIHVLEHGGNDIQVDPAIAKRARVPIDRMLAFTAALKASHSSGELVPHIGAA